MSSFTGIRKIDRDERITARTRQGNLRQRLVPTINERRASETPLMRQITRLYDPERLEDLESLNSAFNDLPPDQRHLVAHGNLIAIWRSK